MALAALALVVFGAIEYREAPLEPKAYGFCDILIHL